MNPGRLSKRVTIQQRNTGQDANGQPVETWATVATVWADIRFVSGLEAIKSDTPVDVVSASIRIRYLAGVIPSMRVVYDGANFDIKAVLPDNGERFMDLVAQTGANLG